MQSFSTQYIQKLLFHPSTASYLAQCGEALGMQELWKRVRPEILKNLRESSIVQSVESSNRIEGVEVLKGRLIPLVLGNVKPRDRSEEEIIGYRKALNFIHNKYREIEVSPASIKKLHLYAQGGMISDAGVWKSKNNEIIEISSQGDRQIRFIPTLAAETSKAIEQLCLGYTDVTVNSKIPGLIAVANFIFDFLCIHPFRDGNGRVSRLLTLLLLYKNGFDVGRYISLEKLVEDSKDDYYRVLGECSQGWHEQTHRLMPWWNYFLSIVKSGYQELKERVELTVEGDHKSAMLRQSILAFPVSFCIADILNLHSNVGRELIKKVLAQLRHEKRISSLGKGRSARWKVNG